MVIPIMASVFGLVIIGFLWTILDPVMMAFLGASAINDSTVSLLRFLWDTFPLWFFLASALALFLLAQKKGESANLG